MVPFVTGLSTQCTRNATAHPKKCVLIDPICYKTTFLSSPTQITGANLDVDVPWKWLNFFMEDDAQLAHIGAEYSAGRMMTGEVKATLIELLVEMVARHQSARGAVSDEIVDAFMAVRDMTGVVGGSR
jgi:tryptophanyl-tRNA synthetase